MTDKTFEKYKDIPGYEGIYQVSNKGNVKRLSRKQWMSRNNCYRTFKEKILAFTLDKRGYYRITLTKDRKNKNFKVHQLVAMAFLKHKPCGYKKVVDHKDNNPLNNSVENLQIISARENVSKDKKDGTSEFTGVWWSKVANKWQAGIRINNKLNHLGYFDDELLAAEKYRNALKEINI